MARRTDGNGPAATDGAEQPVGPAVALGVLVAMAAVALRGYVPGAEEPARDRTTENPAATGLVLGLLIASIGVVAVAVIARLRSRRAPARQRSGRPDWFRGERSRPTWRVLVIAFGVVVAWLLAVMVLNRLGATVAVGPPDAAVPAPSQAVPTPSPAEPPTQPGEPSDGTNLFGPFYGATVAFLVILVVGTVVASRGRRRGVAPAPPPDAYEDAVASGVASESLVRAAEVGLAEVEDPSREPRRAIIACYAAMEGELSRLPDAMPQDFDTASEVLARAVAHHALRPDSATQLVDLFDEARFSPHVMTEAHRDAAVRVLQSVVVELRNSHAAAEVGSDA
jgi:hypothetical protein